MVTSAWTAINANRSMIMGLPSTVWTTAPTKLTDQPFQPPSAGYINAGDLQFPNGQGVRTQFWAWGTFPNPAQTHPYLRNELLTKIYNNVTTRSNTFAVYCTIGYFEVTNAGPFGPTNRPASARKSAATTAPTFAINSLRSWTGTKLTTVPTLGNSPESASAVSRVSVVRAENRGQSHNAGPGNEPRDQNSSPCRFNVPATSGSVVSISGIYDGQSWVLSPR